MHEIWAENEYVSMTRNLFGVEGGERATQVRGEGAECEDQQSGEFFGRTAVKERQAGTHRAVSPTAATDADATLGRQQWPRLRVTQSPDIHRRHAHTFRWSVEKVTELQARFMTSF